MPDIYSYNGDYLKTILVPGTVGYPINTDDMSEEEIEMLEPITVFKYEDDD